MVRDKVIDLKPGQLLLKRRLNFRVRKCGGCSIPINDFGLTAWFNIYEKRTEAKKNKEVVFNKWKWLRTCKYTLSPEYFLYWGIRFDWIRRCSINRSGKEIFASKKLFYMIFFQLFLFMFYLFILFIYLCITFLRPIQGLFNDRIYKVYKDFWPKRRGWFLHAWSNRLLKDWIDVALTTSLGRSFQMFIHR